jgi:hypothetical protein
MSGERGTAGKLFMFQGIVVHRMSLHSCAFDGALCECLSPTQKTVFLGKNGLLGHSSQRSAIRHGRSKGFYPPQPSPPKPTDDQYVFMSRFWRNPEGFAAAVLKPAENCIGTIRRRGPINLLAEHLRGSMLRTR